MGYDKSFLQFLGNQVTHKQSPMVILAKHIDAALPDDPSRHCRASRISIRLSPEGSPLFGTNLGSKPIIPMTPARTNSFRKSPGALLFDGAFPRDAKGNGRLGAESQDSVSGIVRMLCPASFSQLDAGPS